MGEDEVAKGFTAFVTLFKMERGTGLGPIWLWAVGRVLEND